MIKKVVAKHGLHDEPHQRSDLEYWLGCTPGES
jgi:hypothetical protein